MTPEEATQINKDLAKLADAYIAEEQEKKAWQLAYQNVHAENEELQSQLAAAATERDRLRAVLAIYANDDNWSSTKSDLWYSDDPSLPDVPAEIARAALEDTP